MNECSEVGIKYNVRNEINCSFQLIIDAAVAVVPKINSFECQNAVDNSHFQKILIK